MVLYKGALSARDTDKAEYFKSTAGIKLEGSVLKIGVLIGGNSKTYRMKADSIKKLFAYIDARAVKEGINLLVTTSRRTPDDVAVLIKDYLAAKTYCRLLVIANENNPHGSFDAILSAADIIITTSDSISMISEALSWGKKVYVFKSGKGSFKSERFIKQLFAEGLIEVITADDLDKDFTLSKKCKEVRLNNKDSIRKALIEVI